MKCRLRVALPPVRAVLLLAAQLNIAFSQTVVWNITVMEHAQEMAYCLIIVLTAAQVQNNAFNFSVKNIYKKFHIRFNIFSLWNWGNKRGNPILFCSAGVCLCTNFRAFRVCN